MEMICYSNERFMGIAGVGFEGLFLAGDVMFGQWCYYFSSTKIRHKSIIPLEVDEDGRQFKFP